MRERKFDPLRLDVEAFAEAGGHLSGEWPLLAMERLSGCSDPQTPPSDTDTVRWDLRGEVRRAAGRGSQAWLAVSAQAGLSMTCQRCLAPLSVALDLSREICFVEGEDAAAELDEDSEDDVLALTRALNARSLLEDELLLALPLVPRHDQCPTPVVMSAGEASVAEARPAPFAALAGWKPKNRS